MVYKKGASIAISILAGILTHLPKAAALIYISAYLGCTVVPTHLCFAFTEDYFKCLIGKIYRYVVLSFIVTLAAALLVYFFGNAPASKLQKRGWRKCLHVRGVQISPDPLEFYVCASDTMRL
ncbi:MAG: DUF401 family protein [Candidatus Bathyarchaeia archaeon]|jgi:hypothetical protein